MDVEIPDANAIFNKSPVAIRNQLNYLFYKTFSKPIKIINRSCYLTQLRKK